MQQFGLLDEIRASKNCIPRALTVGNGDISNSILAETSVLIVGLLVHRPILPISKEESSWCSG
jgi:hypothetical protein